MRLRIGVATIFAAAVLVLASAACTPSGTTSGPGAELVKAKCTLCHTIDRVNQANLDLAGWEQSIARMRAKGAVLTDAEAAQIAAYLSESGAKK